MSEALLSEFIDDFPLLIEAGFVAVKQLDEVNATRLFNAAQAISPQSTAPQIGLGYIALNKLELKEAMRIFEGVIKAEPENYLAQTFFGICLLLTKTRREEGEKLIQEATAKTNDPTVKSLGAISLEWADKDLSKKGPPFFADLESKDK
ncbi:MAG: SctF chaperone SctG [Parachlamydiaceae bacterium]|nr:SctF chaperone SctG [Parachlamydiaceae bacterium]